MAGDHKCPYHDLTEDAAKPFVGSISFYTFDRILAGACTAFCVVVIFFHILNHAIHLSNPAQQIKIMRVSLLAPTYSILSLLQICFPTAAVYIIPWLDVAQANCLASYFLLLCELVSPEAESRNHFFSTIEINDGKLLKRKGKGNGRKIDGVQWLQKRWVGLFQYPVVALIVAIAICVTQGLDVYCQYVSKPYFAKLWLSIAKVISPAVAFLSSIAVAINLRAHMPHTKPLTKLVTVKLIVGLGFFQQIVFWIVESTNVLKPSATMTYADKNIGIPALLSCLEMVPICLLVVWAYPVSPYHIKARNSGGSPQQSYQGGILGIKAFLAVWNPSETIKGSVFAFKILTNQVPARSVTAASAPRPTPGRDDPQREYEMLKPGGRP